MAQKAKWSGNRQMAGGVTHGFCEHFARPDGFEPPTTWFEVRTDGKLENIEFCN
jgi:hypothetical protein